MNEGLKTTLLLDVALKTPVDPWLVKLPVPLMSPPLQVTVPRLVTARFSGFVVAELNVREAPAATVVVPVPLIVPALQLDATDGLVSVTLSDPVSVAPLRVRVAMLTASPLFSVTVPL